MPLNKETNQPTNQQVVSDKLDLEVKAMFCILNYANDWI